MNKSLLAIGAVVILVGATQVHAADHQTVQALLTELGAQDQASTAEIARLRARIQQLEASERNGVNPTLQEIRDEARETERNRDQLGERLEAVIPVAVQVVSELEPRPLN